MQEQVSSSEGQSGAAGGGNNNTTYPRVAQQVKQRSKFRKIFLEESMGIQRFTFLHPSGKIERILKGKQLIMQQKLLAPHSQQEQKMPGPKQPLQQQQLNNLYSEKQTIKFVTERGVNSIIHFRACCQIVQWRRSVGGCYISFQI